MPEFPRTRPHFYLHDVGHDEPYTSPRQGRTPPPPIRDRAAHALALQTALNQALGAAHSQVQIQAQEGRTGFYLQFELAPGNAEFAQNVEDMHWPLLGGAVVFVLGLAFGIPRDLKARRIRKYGRRTKGPELVTAAAFNRRNRSDGIGFQTKERRTLGEFLLGREGNMVRIPQDKESSHVMMMGDTGSGKSSLNRQILLQVEQRGFKGSSALDRVLSAFTSRSRVTRYQTVLF